MKQVFYKIYPGDQVTDSMLYDAAKLFSENYGIWGKKSHKPGKRIIFNPRRLREQILPDPSACSLVRVTVDGKLTGHVFACRWQQDGRRVCWVTQLVVHRDYRERGFASGLLRSLRLDADDDVYGIMSSHPAACMTAASAFGVGIERVSLDFIRQNAKEVIKASPIPYVREAGLHGSIFEPGYSSGLVCGVDTRFFVDHGEPVETLRRVRETREWPLGELPEGHEYLLVLPGKKRLLEGST